MNETILITGASGFIGKHLVAALQNLKLDVRPHSLRQGLPDLLPGTVSHVFHLAAKTYVPESWSDPLSFYEANTLGTIKILDFCRQVGSPITIVSSYVYGHPSSLPVSEDTPIRAFNPYSQSKILAEQAAQYYAEAFGVSVRLIRPFNLYGPFQDSRFIIPTLLQQALDPSLSVFSVADSRPRRDFLFINDFIDLLIRTRSTTVVPFSVFNAGSGSSVSISDLCNTLNALTGMHKGLVSRGERRPNEVLDVFADISKAQRQLHWSPKTSIEKGLALTIDALKQVKSENSKWNRSVEEYKCNDS